MLSRTVDRVILQRIQRRLHLLYGDEAPALTERFLMMLGRYGIDVTTRPNVSRWGFNDVVLITYADSLRSEGRTPLQTLHHFAKQNLKNALSTVHLLPFSPWSSDDGFSVIDYRAVEDTSGTWADVDALGKDFDLMFDLVLNHCSSKSSWFRDFVIGSAPAKHYFLPMDPKTDLSEVTRPRSSPLLTKTATRSGDQYVWTTFSADQVDLNWQNPDVLFEFLDILFLYLSHGCRILRLDAIAFLWKRLGTTCLHLPETHEVVKLLRDVFEIVAPEALLLTETNVPHEENISYFGAGDEAHMVYNFSLPPLLLHGLLRGDSTHLSEWARTLPDLPPGQTFFNFTSSHDGIGVRPLQGILDDEIPWLVQQVRDRGGRVNMRAMPDGSERPYELNITYRDALDVIGDEEASIARFLCSQAVMLAFRGMPAVYIHCLLGTPNYQEGVEETGHNRTINRRKWDLGELDAVLADKNSAQARIFARYLLWLRRRQNHSAFHPDGDMQILDLGAKVFGFLRISMTGAETVACLFNFSGEAYKLRLADVHPRLGEVGTCRDILSATLIKTGPRRHLTMPPYFAYWLVVR